MEKHDLTELEGASRWIESHVCRVARLEWAEKKDVDMVGLVLGTRALLDETPLSEPEALCIPLPRILLPEPLPSEEFGIRLAAHVKALRHVADRTAAVGVAIVGVQECKTGTRMRTRIFVRLEHQQGTRTWLAMAAGNALGEFELSDDETVDPQYARLLPSAWMD